MSLSSIHHSFDTQLAAQFGIEEAILIHHFQHWIGINRNLKKNLRDGRTWSYQSQEWIAAHFSYLSKFQVKRTIKKLIKAGVLLVGNYNKKRYDHTNWYAFVDEGKYMPLIEMGRNRPINETESPHQKDEIVPAIPDAITDALKDSEKSSLKRAKTIEESLYQGRFENKINVSPENYKRLLLKFKDADLIDEYAEKLYRWSFNNELAFKKKKRHDMVMEDWLEKDLKEKKQKTNNFDKDLNVAQIKHWEENKALVALFKTDFNHKASGLNFYYKAHILKDKANENFSLSGLIEPRDFERVLAKHLGIKIHEQV